MSSENWTFNKQNDAQKYKATIPGTVHTDLFQNKLIPDPFFGANEKQLQWIEHENWEYETYFPLSKVEFQNQNIDLEFDGLDTYATVYLNGKVVLEADNMFRKWVISAKSYLKKDNNHLKIVFHSTVKKGKEEAEKLPYTLPENERIFVRKAQYQFGWDWGPRFVTAGIWRKVQLKFWNSAKIENVRYDQKVLNAEKALLDFIFTIEVQKSGKYQIYFGAKQFHFNLKKGINTVKIPIEIKDPILWWSNGLGIPHQYAFHFQLQKNNEKLDEKQLKIGLRTIELIQQKDDKGTGFAFKLNGKMVYMKGANYIPPDSFLPRVKDSTYKSLVANAKKANMNMLRVWGGGVYPDEAFYDACDANGILVWQDFMFACAMYPGDKKFIKNVKQEVIYQVNRLQNHPSLALWCGNNENDEGWHNWGWQKQHSYTKSDSMQIWNDYKKVFREVIPNTLDSLVSKEKNVYWSSSPSIGWGRKESMTQGDSHYWGVWWGKEPFEIYKTKVPRFMSEYGFQSMPNIETLRKVVLETDLNFNSEALKNHQKHPIGYETIREYMERDFIVPTKFEDYIYVSQLLQADGMKTAMEAHRRAKPYNMGTLYWQFNDCWPVTSWSSLDFYGNWKAFHYQAKRSFENLLISVNEENEFYKVYLINDNFETYSDKLTLKLLSFDGKILWQSSKKINVEENSSTIVFEIAKEDFSKFDLKEAVLDVRFKNASSNYYFAKPKDLQLTKPTIQVEQIDDLTIEVSTDVLAKDVYLYSENEVFFDDNYFDLLPNQKRIIKLNKPARSIKIKIIFDTLK
ncbi:beta-mannosidase [Flavobacterium antarcticum]|uniref:beta-mannosidase n=1 Tax=Flavobacterium antarcticum TaxID=271155 RepID=UPI0009FE509A|nr:glycoside hydrolase family 2 protein [Flavobacterium antarcticum]